MLNSAISVKQLNLYVKSLLECDKRLSYVSVEGELSNFKNNYPSGHWYFTVKDSDASIRCVMFKSSALRVDFKPLDGMRVILSGRVSLYEKDGQYQFYAEKMVPYGEGDLSAKFRMVKEKLEKEGLFSVETKRPINKMPKRIAVITSDSGAALHDICKTLEARMPLCEIIVCPCFVQGDFAVDSMLKALDRVYKLQDIDTIIIGRGGGSAEDLSAFNDEMLARKIYESPFPVISAVGHETDFSICDFVADVRAATPTAAAMIASENIQTVKESVNSLNNRLNNAIYDFVEKNELRLKAVLSSRFIKNPQELIDRKLQTVDYLSNRLNNATERIMSDSQNRLLNSVNLLDSLSPLKTIKRGFAIALKNDKPIKSVNELKNGDEFKVKFSDGNADCRVERITNE